MVVGVLKICDGRMYCVQWMLSKKGRVCVCFVCCVCVPVVCVPVVCVPESEGTNSNFEIILAQIYADNIHDFSERNTEATWMGRKSLIYRIG